MDGTTRVCIAFIAGHIISGRESTHIYDYSESRYIEIGGSITGNSVNILNYDQSRYFFGTLSNLYNSDTGTYLRLDIRGDQFSGYDDVTRREFTGEVNDDTITIYDDIESQYFSYRL